MNFLSNYRILVSKVHGVLSYRENEWSRFRNQYIVSESKASDATSVEAFQLFAEIIQSSDLTCWASCGTLLGLVRDEKLIPWDNDADFDYVWKDWSTLFSIVDKLVENNFLVIIRPGRLFTSINAFKKGFKCSLGKVIGFRNFYYTRSMHYPRDSIKSVPIGIYFPSVKSYIMLPANHKSILEYIYKNWRTPIASDDFSDYANTSSVNGSFLLLVLTSIDNFLINGLVKKFKNELRKLIL